MTVHNWAANGGHMCSRTNPDLTGPAINCTHKYQTMKGLDAMVRYFDLFALSSSLAYENLKHFEVLKTP